MPTLGEMCNYSETEPVPSFGLGRSSFAVMHAYSCRDTRDSEIVTGVVDWV